MCVCVCVCVCERVRGSERESFTLEGLDTGRPAHCQVDIHVLYDCCRALLQCGWGGCVCLCVCVCGYVPANRSASEQ